LGISNVLSVTMTVSQTASFDWSHPVEELTLNPIIFSVGPIPVVLVPELNFTVGLDASARASVSASAQVSQSLVAGMSMVAGTWSPVAHQSHTYSAPSVNAQVTAQADAYVESPNASILVYGVLGPSMTLQPSLVLNGTAPHCPALSAELDFSGSAGIDLGFLEDTDQILTFPLFNLQSPLWSFPASCPTAVTFDESGLPLGTSWSVLFNGTTNSSDGTEIGFLSPNGTYSYSIGAVAGFGSLPPGGSIRVTGSPVDQPVNFTAAGSASYDGVTAAGAIVYSGQSSLTVPATGSTFLFAFGTGGNGNASGFVNGSIDQASTSGGDVAAGLATSASNSDRFAPNAPHYSIGGVAVSGYLDHNETNFSFVPPVEPTSYFNFSFSINGSALAILIEVSAGQCCQTFSGVPNITTLADWDSYGGTGLVIADAGLTPGSYTLSGATTNGDSGSATRVDLVGIFLFAQSSIGYVGGAKPDALPWSGVQSQVLPPSERELAGVSTSRVASSDIASRYTAQGMSSLQLAVNSPIFLQIRTEDGAHAPELVCHRRKVRKQAHHHSQLRWPPGKLSDAHPFPVLGQ
jgi:hypothetical protein